MFESDVAAMALGTLLLVGTAAVLIVALVLTSRDLASEQRVARRRSTLNGALPTEPGQQTAQTLGIERDASSGDAQFNDFTPVDIEKEIASGSMTEA